MVKSKKKSYIKKNTKMRKSGSKTRRNKKGGLLWSPSMTVAGVKIGSDRGEKRYNWSTGKWDDYICYGIGPLSGCRIVPAK